MSFLQTPTTVRMPTVPGFYISDNIWTGTGKDAGLIAFVCSPYGAVMTKNELCYSLNIDGSTAAPVYSSVNGYIYWGTGRYLYYSSTYGWIISNKFPGYEPQETYDSETKKYEGDLFWSGTMPALGDGASSMFEPRGTGKNQDSGISPLEVKPSFPRWQSSSGVFGEYLPMEGNTGEKYLGVPQWQGDNKELFTRSQAQDSSGHYTYGRIYYSGETWLIGEQGAEDGWWEGKEPQMDGTVVFHFKTLPESEAIGENISVSFKEYVAGTETASVFLGEVAIWR